MRWSSPTHGEGKQHARSVRFAAESEGVSVIEHMGSGIWRPDLVIVPLVSRYTE